MKIPKNFNTYCPSCKTHTLHVVERVKKGQASTLTRIVRQKARHTGIGNSGKFSKVPGGESPQSALTCDTDARPARKPIRNLNVSGQGNLRSWSLNYGTKEQIFKSKM